MAAADPTSEANLEKLSIDDLMAFAKVVEEAERYKDMIKISSCTIRKAYATEPPSEKDLKAKDDNMVAFNQYQQSVKDRRNHVSVAYKNVVGNQRNAWRTIRDKTDDDSDADKVLKGKYQKYIRQVITCVCNKVIQLITTAPLKGYELSAAATPGNKAKFCFNVEDTVFWLKMVGDYCRYLAELDKEDKDMQLPPVEVILNAGLSKDDKQPAAEWAKDYYQAAVNLCQKDPDPDKKIPGLAVTHPIRLGLALNFSVCYYECLNQSNKAIDMARDAFDHAIEKLDTLNDDSYKDSTLIMQLLRDNMTLWQQEQADENRGAEDEA